MTDNNHTPVESSAAGAAAPATPAPTHAHGPFVPTDAAAVAAPITPAAAAAISAQQARLECRMYAERYPEVDDLVMVNVRQIAEMGAYVHLLEYNNIEGMILLNELSRRRIRSIQKLIRVGKNEVVVVLRVDREKGYIDLSKRRVSPEDIAKCEEKYNKSKTVHSIMRHVAEKLSMSLEDLYNQIGWPLYEKFGHAYKAFEQAVSDPDRVFEGMNVSEEIRRELILNIRRRLTPQAIKIRADIEVTCFSYEGIDAVKAALAAGEAMSTPEVPIKITLVAPPLYIMITNSLDKNLGLQVMEKAVQKIEETIKASAGNLNVKMKPRAVSETDDIELEKMIDEADRMNRDVDGDDDVSGSLSSASPARSLAQGSTNPSKSSTSSSITPDSTANSTSTPFHHQHWDEQLLAHSSFFCRHRPLVAPADHHKDLLGRLDADDVLAFAASKLSLKGETPTATAGKKNGSNPRNLAGASVWIAKSPQDLVPKALRTGQAKENYNDEYAKLFGSFNPYAPPNDPSSASQIDSLLNLGEAEQKDMMEEAFARLMNSNNSNSVRQRLVNKSGDLVGRIRRRNVEPILDQMADAEIVQAIGIKKIRRKKMNKHKKKKQRRLVRDSSRYNKAKRKKSGPMREKQE
ncbi:hypothetical protein HDV05_005985 [Chytridiales sp. JEL 0842]|nr:hypothetical protein HDV05_005985 [Chytridiales sp. JEL 0842]